MGLYLDRRLYERAFIREEGNLSQEVGYRFVELNASATRSKRTLHDEVAGHLCCLSMDAFVEGGGGMTSGRRHALIMDEVDGMAGNEDRGGVQVWIVPVYLLCILFGYCTFKTLDTTLCTHVTVEANTHGTINPFAAQLTFLSLTLCFRIIGADPDDKEHSNPHYLHLQRPAAPQDSLAGQPLF